MKNYGGYQLQQGSNNKMAYKTTCQRDLVHMKCAIFIKDLKWQKQSVSEHRIDYVCFGLEQVRQMANKSQECVICLSVFQTKQTHQWRKTISLIAVCEFEDCTTQFHVDCLIYRKAKVLWNKLAAKIYVYCPIHFKEMCHSLECLDWVNIEKVIMHIVNVSLESEEANNCNQERKQIIQIEQEEDDDSLEDQPLKNDGIFYEGQRNIQKLYREPSIPQQYSKPPPQFQINYMNRPEMESELINPQIQYDNECQNNIDKQQAVEEEYGEQKEQDYTNYFKKPTTNDKLYEQRMNEDYEDPKKKKQKDGRHFKEIDQLEDFEQTPKPEQQKQITPINQDKSQNSFMVVQEESIPQAQPKPSKIRKKQAKTYIKKQEEEYQNFRTFNNQNADSQSQCPSERPQETTKQQTNQQAIEDSDIMIDIQMEPPKIRNHRSMKQAQGFRKLEYTQDDGFEITKNFWDEIDKLYFQVELPPQVIKILDNQSQFELNELEDLIPSLHMSQNNQLNVLVQGQEMNYYLQYEIINVNVQHQIINVDNLNEKSKVMKDEINGNHQNNGINTIIPVQIRDRDGKLILMVQYDQKPSFLLYLLTITDLCQREYQSCIKYQQVLRGKSQFQLLQQLDNEYQYLIDEFNAIQDELQVHKQKALNQQKQSIQDFQAISLKINDDLLWFQMSKNVANGLKKKLSKEKDYEFGIPAYLLHCKVCFNKQSSSYNQVQSCKICQTSYHKLCYGTSNLYLNHTLCDVCLFQKNHNVSLNKVSCFLCKQYYESIPLKQLRGNFFHVTCLINQNFIVYEQSQLIISKKISQQGVDSYIIRNQETKCIVCNDVKGEKNKCILKGCDNHAHILCAYLYGLYLELGVELFTNTNSNYSQDMPGNCTIRIKCQKHDTNRQPNIEQMFLRCHSINYKQAFHSQNIDQFISKLDDPIALSMVGPRYTKYQDGYKK